MYPNGTSTFIMDEENVRHAVASGILKTDAVTFHLYDFEAGATQHAINEIAVYGRYRKNGLTIPASAFFTCCLTYGESQAVKFQRFM